MTAGQLPVNKGAVFQRTENLADNYLLLLSNYFFTDLTLEAQQLRETIQEETIL